MSHNTRSGPSLVAQTVKDLPSMRENLVQPLGWEDPLEEETATHSSILAFEIPWTEELGGLQSMGSQHHPRPAEGSLISACAKVF